MSDQLQPFFYKRRNERWEESCTAQLSLKLPSNIKEKLIDIPGWQDILRGIIEKMIDDNGK